MNRNTLFLVLLGLFFMLGGYGLSEFIAADKPSGDAQSNQQPVSLASIPFTDLQGRQYLLKDWQQPLLIINFWAPWCVPCRREVPTLVAVQQQFSDQVQILGLALDSAENVESFSAEYSMNYPSFLAGNQIPMYNAAFGNKSGSLPFTAFVDHERKVRYVHTGEISFEQIREKIAEIL